MKTTAAVSQLGDVSLLLVKILEDAFLPGGVREKPGAPVAEIRLKWRQHYFASVQRLRDAGIETIEDSNAGAEMYVSLRSEWEPYIGKLTRAGAYRPDEIDPTLQ